MSRSKCAEARLPRRSDRPQRLRASVPALMGPVFEITRQYIISDVTAQRERLIQTRIDFIDMTCKSITT